MRVTARIFALHRDVVGAQQLDMEVDQGSTAGDLWALLGERFPELLPATRSLMFAVNQVFAEPATELHEGDEVAFIPPVSGGAPETFRPFAITDQALHPEPLTSYVQTPSAGALVLFAGVARDNFGGRATAHLFYDAYAAMAEPVLEQIAGEAAQRWQIGRVAVHHRVGRLEIGDTAVLVAVAAPHRREAFEAAAYIMDRIKEIAPIWKREAWADGTSEWIGDEKTRGKTPQGMEDQG